MGLRLVAAFWGLAEATLFFIVPDVLLSAVALRSRRKALELCLWALAGALVGGTLMYLWGARAPEQVWTLLSWVPAVSEPMMTSVSLALLDTGVWATIWGPLSGTPYKLYAALAPSAEISLGLFLLVSIPARLIRFVLLSLVAAWLAERWLTSLSYRQRLGWLLSFWVIFYALFLSVMPW